MLKIHGLVVCFFSGRPFCYPGIFNHRFKDFFLFLRYNAAATKQDWQDCGIDEGGRLLRWPLLTGRGEAEAYDEERQWAHELAIQNAALLNWLGAMVRKPLIREIQRFGIRSQPFVWRRISIFSGVGE